jgi:hypothetical protein
MQNARSTAAISRASEGYHFSHDALVTCKLPIAAIYLDAKRIRHQDAESKLGTATLTEIDKKNINLFEYE